MIRPLHMLMCRGLLFYVQARAEKFTVNAVCGSSGEERYF